MSTQSGHPRPGPATGTSPLGRGSCGVPISGRGPREPHRTRRPGRRSAAALALTLALGGLASPFVLGDAPTDAAHAVAGGSPHSADPSPTASPRRVVPAEAATALVRPGAAAKAMPESTGASAPG